MNSIDRMIWAMIGATIGIIVHPLFDQRQFGRVPDSNVRDSAAVMFDGDVGFRLSGCGPDGFTLRTSFKPCEARVTNGQWTIHFKR